MSKRQVIAAATDKLTKDLTDQGKLIEAGFAAFSLYVISKDAPAVQRREMRLAFMAGAQHLFGSIMGILDPGAEPTEADLRRMDLIASELENALAQIRGYMHDAAVASAAIIAERDKLRADVAALTAALEEAARILDGEGWEDSHGAEARAVLDKIKGTS